MKKFFKSTKLFVSMLVLGCTLGFTSCSDDDDPKLPEEVTTETLTGYYTGKMVSFAVAPTRGEDNGEETPSGVDVKAQVANDTIYFEQFPIKDIVLSVVGDEAVADNIVEAVGDVNYKIGYKAEFTQEKDSIRMVLDPKPLLLTIAVPASNEDEEPQTLQITVNVKAGEDAGYDIESANMKFYFGATEVLLGEGDNQQALPGFRPTTFHFDMDKYTVAHTNF